MNLKNKIILKLACAAFIIFYYYSLLWMLLMYLLGFLYIPINNSFLKQYLPFEYLSLLILVIGLIWLIFKSNGTKFIHVLLQDIGIIILSIPLLFIVFSIFKMSIDDGINTYFIVIRDLLLTILFVNYNDYKKLKKM